MIVMTVCTTPPKNCRKKNRATHTAGGDEKDRDRPPSEVSRPDVQRRAIGSPDGGTRTAPAGVRNHEQEQAGQRRRGEGEDVGRCRHTRQGDRDRRDE